MPLTTIKSNEGDQLTKIAVEMVSKWVAKYYGANNLTKGEVFHDLTL